MLSTVYYWYKHCCFDPIIVFNAKDKIRLEQKEGLQSEYHMLPSHTVIVIEANI